MDSWLVAATNFWLSCPIPAGTMAPNAGTNLRMLRIPFWLGISAVRRASYASRLANSSAPMPSMMTV